MRRRLIVTVILLATLLLTIIGGPVSAKNSNSEEGYAPDRILIKFRPGTSESLKGIVHGLYGGKVKRVIQGIDVQVVEVPANKLQEKTKAYRGEANVEFVEPDYTVSADPLIGLATLANPNDYFFYDQWALNNTGQRVPGITNPPDTGTPGTFDADIDAPEAWTVTQGSSKVLIAILDTGIDQNHEDLTNQIKANKNFTDSPTVDDIAGHGTHVAGITAAITNNTLGVAGIANNSLLLNGKVLNDSGIGYNSWIANGIIWAADQGAKVINLSLGGSGYSLTVSNAVNYAWNKGSIIVAAAGNNGNSSPFYPAYYSNCIAVAATDQNDARASFSNYGSWVDIAAPGVNIISTYPDPTLTYVYAYASGTSMASPQVAGVAALVWASEYGKNNSSVRSRIQSTADPISGTGTYWQNGRVNAYNAVAPPDTSPPAQVSGLTVTAVSSSQLNLSWNANTEPDLKNYRVYRSTVSGGPYSLIASPTVNSYSDSGLAAATNYYYVLSAVDSSGNEGLKSEQASGTTSQASKMHVGSITMALKKTGNYTYAVATITIVDAAGKPVVGAKVSGRWSGATSDSDTALTNGSGQVTVQSNLVRRPPSGKTFTFTVNNVTLSSWVYDSAANAETSDSIKVP